MFEFYTLAFILGLATGSFLNVCIVRIPRGGSVISPPSHCTACGQRLVPRDLIPVVSYLLLGGRCRYCGVRISPRYAVVELATGVLFLAAAWRFGFTLQALNATVFSSILLVVSLTDIEHRIIPNKVLAAGLLLGLLLSLPDPVSIFYSRLPGLAAGGIPLALVALVSRGGMGGGDVKLAAVQGYYLGWPLVLVALFISFVLGAVAGLTWVGWKRKTMKEAIPFGPFLSLGAAIALFWGDRLLGWYLSLL